METNFKAIEPFTDKDLYSYFLQGIFFGLAILGLLAIGAWLVSIMRKRINDIRSNPFRQSENRRSENQDILTHDPTIQPF
jgi:hypothetical protein